MPVITNAWTQQSPLSASGSTGAQSVKIIPACRVFVKTAESVTAAPVNTYAAYGAKTNGTTPTGWTDLGIMAGVGKLTYNKNITKVQTGLDKITRAQFVSEIGANFEFDLSQFDDLVLTTLGFTTSVITSGSTVNFQVGQEGIVSKALLMVYANKIDGKEIQWYHPAAQLSVTAAQNGDEFAVHVAAELVAFRASGASSDSIVSCTVFA